MTSIEYERKKDRERKFYVDPPRKGGGFVGRVLRHRVFYNPERISFNYIFPREQMADAVRRLLNGRRVERMLFAPCGGGGEYAYLGGFADRSDGIDLSPLAVGQCDPGIHAKVGDILESGYPDAAFDLIVCSAFFHHVLGFGFDPFLKEFRRILKPDGKLVILEPSLWYPLNLVTRPIKRLFGNPYDEVEDEAPFRPRIMVEALERTGFVNIGLRGATFSHCSFFIPLAKTVNRLTRPFLRFGPTARMAWWVLYWAEKGEGGGSGNRRDGPGAGKG